MKKLFRLFLLFVLIPAFYQVQGQICTPDYTNNCTSVFIESVSFNTLENLNSGCNGNPQNYINYSKEEFSTVLEHGAVYDLSVRVSYNTQSVGVFIDMDGDGSFSGTDEFIDMGTIAGSSESSVAVQIPDNSPAGDVRVRVVSRYYDVVSHGDTCASMNYGETEDYIITLAEPSPMSVENVETFQEPITVSPGSDVPVLRTMVSTSGSLSSLALEQLEFYLSGTSLEDVDSVSLAVGSAAEPQAVIAINKVLSEEIIRFPLSETLETGKNYFWLVYHLDSSARLGHTFDASLLSAEVDGISYFPENGAPEGEFLIDYCTPYFSSCYGNNIDYIYLNTLSYEDASCNSEGYVFVPDSVTTTTLEQGGDYNLSLGIPVDTYAGVFIDYNENGYFNDNNETAYTGFLNAGEQTVALNIPEDVPAGRTRIRVMFVQNELVSGDMACDSFVDGYTQDFIIDIAEPSAMEVEEVVLEQKPRNVEPGSIRNEVLLLNIKTRGSLSPLQLDSLMFFVTGSDPGNDISQMNIVSYGNLPHDNDYASDLPAEINGNDIYLSDDLALTPGNNYFALHYDIHPDADIRNTIDGILSELEINRSSHTPDNRDPEGNLLIYHCTPSFEMKCEAGERDFSFTIGEFTIENLPCNGSDDNFMLLDSSGYHLELEKGGDYDVSFIENQSYTTRASLYIDFDGDGEFTGEDGEGQYLRLSDFSSAYTTANLNIPESSVEGWVRARLLFSNAGEDAYCSSFWGGRVVDFYVKIKPQTPMTISSVDIMQTEDMPVYPGASDKVLAGIKISVTGTQSPLLLSDLFLNSGSTDDTSDIAGLDIYSSVGENSAMTNMHFAESSAFGEEMKVSGSTPLYPGDNYFWLYVNVDSSAQVGNFIEAVWDSIGVTDINGILSYISADISGYQGEREVIDIHTMQEAEIKSCRTFFFDEGGPAGDSEDYVYQPPSRVAAVPAMDSTLTTVLYPEEQGMGVVLEMLQMGICGYYDCDSLVIYNGSERDSSKILYSASGPVYDPGGEYFSVRSTAENGALTIYYNAGTDPGEGFEAFLSCYELPGPASTDTIRAELKKQGNIFVIDVSGGEPSYTATILHERNNEIVDTIYRTFHEQHYEVTLEGPGTYTLIAVRDAGENPAEATGTVEVFNELQAYQGVSPNNDGLNDGFIVDGLELHPDNELFIFNREGKVVYNKKNYVSREWKATNNSGTAISDGTYFFILRDADGERLLSGYLEVRR